MTRSLSPRSSDDEPPAGAALANLGRHVYSHSTTKVLLTAGRLLVLLFAAQALLDIRNPTSPSQYAVGFSVCVLAAVAAVGFQRKVAWSVLYLVAFASFAYVRALADETGIAPNYDYVIALERALPGPLPTVWLQDRLWTSSVRTLDVIMVQVHFSFFLAPHALALAIWRWRPALIRRYVLTVMLTLYGATVFAALVPTAPPWLAAEAGLIPEVAKVNDWVYGAIDVNGYTREVVYMNPVAAMPSLHFALTAITLIGLWHFGQAARAFGIVYLAIMGFALVYMGEHWVVDLAGGAILVAVAWHFAGRLDAFLSRPAARLIPRPFFGYRSRRADHE